MRAAGATENTVRIRTYHVTRVARLVQRPASEVTVEELVAWLGAQAWAPETRRAYRASLRSFFSYVQASGVRPDNPGALLPKIDVPRGVPRPTPEAVLRAALERCDTRTRIAVLLAAVCGMRRGEIAAATRRDIVRDLVGWSIVVHGKGGHVRTVPLPNDLGRELVRLPHGALVPSLLTGGHLTPAHVGKIVSRVLGDGWTTHTLRHRCATVAYAAERDLRAVQELLGHAKPETTQRYTAITPDAVRACIAATAV